MKKFLFLMFTILICVCLLSSCNHTVSNNEEPEFKEINSWLFDDSQNVKDIEAIGIDFCNSLKKELGIKNTRSKNAIDNIELPSSTENGTINITGFAKKMLDEMFIQGTIYRSVGFFAAKLTPQNSQQISLFDGAETIKKQELSKSWDKLEEKFGKGVIKLGNKKPLS